MFVNTFVNIYDKSNEAQMTSNLATNVVPIHVKYEVDAPTTRTSQPIRRFEPTHRVTDLMKRYGGLRGRVVKASRFETNHLSPLGFEPHWR